MSRRAQNYSTQSDLISRGGRRVSPKGADTKAWRDRLKPVLHWGSRLCGLAILSGLGYMLWPHLNQPVSEVELTGELTRVDRENLRARIQQNISGGLLSLDLDLLDSAVEDVDWVQGVEVKKRWPQTLVIQVTEERPVARWGEIGYLAESGALVESPLFDDLAELPSFDVRVNEPQRALEVFYDIDAAMMMTGVGIKELRQSEFGSWSMIMENGSHIVLGKEELLVRMRRVIHTWQRLPEEYINDLEVIDARYPNGVAVKYRQQLVHEPPRLDGDEKT